MRPNVWCWLKNRSTGKNLKAGVMPSNWHRDKGCSLIQGVAWITKLHPQMLGSSDKVKFEKKRVMFYSLQMCSVSFVRIS